MRRTNDPDLVGLLALVCRLSPANHPRPSGNGLRPGAGLPPPDAVGRAPVRAISYAIAMEIHAVCNLSVARRGSIKRITSELEKLAAFRAAHPDASKPAT